jgi:hypothetical protein
LRASARRRANGRWAFLRLLRRKARRLGILPVLERNAQTQVERSSKMKTPQFAIFTLLALALLAAMAIALLISLSASID